MGSLVQTFLRLHQDYMTVTKKSRRDYIMVTNDTLAQRIMAIIRTSTTPQTVRGIAAALGMDSSEQVLRNALYLLKKRNMIKKESGVYVLVHHENRLVVLLRFLNDFFKDNADYILADPKIMNFVTKHENEFNEAEKLCQA